VVRVSFGGTVTGTKVVDVPATDAVEIFSDVDQIANGGGKSCANVREVLQPLLHNGDLGLKVSIVDGVRP
jgi:hypothetical protein